MSFSILKQIGESQKKKTVVDVRSGDTVKVFQKIKEGQKFRLQVFEGIVIRTDRKGSHTARITVRKIASGVGVEKSFLLHSPLVEKVEVLRRAKVRRNNLSYLRERFGKSARLSGKMMKKEQEAAEEKKMESEETKVEKIEELKTEAVEKVKTEQAAEVKQETDDNSVEK